MTNIDHLMEGVDLISIHTILSLIGAILTAYLMQLTSHLDSHDPVFIRWFRRATLAGTSLAMLWTVSYSVTKLWQPWPPDLAVIFFVDMMVAIRIGSIYSSLHRRKSIINGQLQRQKARA